MQIAKTLRAVSVPEALLIYFSILFFWHFFFSLLPDELGHIDFLKYSAAAVSIYFVAKKTVDINFWGRGLNSSDIKQISLLAAATIFTGLGFGSLLIYLDATANAQVAVERWGLLSQREFSQLDWTIPWIIGQLITSSFLVPVMEEIIFRGFILQRLRQRYSPVISVIASSALFAALHFNKSYVGAFMHGVIFAVVVIRTSSLYAAIILHCAYNAAIFLLMTLFGVTIIADSNLVSHMRYWAPELLSGVVGLMLFVHYVFYGSVQSSEIER